MKKVLKLILALAMVAALAVTAFASPVTEVLDAASSGDTTLTLSASYDTDNGELNAVVTPTSADEAAFVATDENGVVVAAYDVTIYDAAGNVVTDPVGSFTFVIDGLAQYVGQYITMYHNSDAVSSQLISGDTVSFAYTGSFSPFTFVVTDAPAQTAKSPQTSQTALTSALVCVAVMAVVGTAVAAKRKFD